MLSLSSNYGLGMVIKAHNRASRVIKQVQGDLTGFRKAAYRDLKSVRNRFARFGNELTNLRAGVFKGMQITGFGALMAAPLVLMNKAAIESEDHLSNVRSLLVTSLPTDQIDKSMKQIQKAIFQTGNNIRVPLRELELSMYDLVSADLSVEEAIGALKPTAMLAVAGLGTMDDAVRTNAVLLNTYGKSWGNVMTPMEKTIKISNILAGTVAGYKTTLPELSQALQYSVGSAKALNVPLAELTATIGAAQTSGLQGTLAGTAFNAFLRSATKLTLSTGEEVDGAKLSEEEYRDALLDGAEARTKTALKNLQLVDSTGKLLPIYDILGKIEKSFNINTEAIADVTKEGLKGEAALIKMGISAKQAGELQAVFGDEGSRLIAILLGQSDALKEKVKWLEQSNNLEKMVNARQRNMAARLAITRNKLKALVLTATEGLLGQERNWLEKIGEGIDKVTMFVEGHQGLVGWILKIGGGLAGLTMATGLLKIAFMGLKFVFWGAFGKIGIAIGLISIAVHQVIKHWDSIKTCASIAALYVREYWTKSTEAIKRVWTDVVGWIVDKFNYLANKAQWLADKIAYPFKMISEFFGGQTIQPLTVPQTNFSMTAPPLFGRTPEQLSNMYRAHYGHYNNQPTEQAVEKKVTLDININGSSKNIGVGIYDTVRRAVNDIIREQRILSPAGEM